MLFSEHAYARIEQWASDVCGSKPIHLPVHQLGPENRSYFNVRDFCKQHSCSPVYGWVVENGCILKAHFYSAVRLHGKMFAITKTPVGDAAVLFFEDKKHLPRLGCTSCGCEIVHSFHTLVYPETSPAKKISVVDPKDAIELQMDLPECEKEKKAATMSKSYPPVPATETVAPLVPVRTMERDEDTVIHPFLRKLKRYALSKA